MALRPNSKHIGLDLTLIKCIKIFAMCTFRIMRHIGNNINVLRMMQVTRPLGLRLRLR